MVNGYGSRRVATANRRPDARDEIPIVRRAKSLNPSKSAIFCFARRFSLAQDFVRVLPDSPFGGRKTDTTESEVLLGPEYLRALPSSKGKE
ncbi:uncharacterized protein ATNIH1004_000467 [Aspergillus tanneri]|uniref:Uncharacterized protein n=1 Tax=Aspergillus tanneri TaxID=1220188 RepID=A0A5M9NAL4_9EURO|nr:uncharacterized protein ATNIH1004_000467 [Aspergillus tanneri]KAA8651577.1 hypothetical protein ATNIH1004_000467 [Aspergillus tanneri]